MNLDKTNYLTFSNNKRIVNVLFGVDGVEICRITEVKFLGVLIDEKLKWKPHIIIRIKIAKSTVVLYKVRELCIQSRMQ